MSLPLNFLTKVGLCLSITNFQLLENFLRVVIKTLTIATIFNTNGWNEVFKFFAIGYVTQIMFKQDNTFEIVKFGDQFYFEADKSFLESCPIEEDYQDI